MRVEPDGFLAVLVYVTALVLNTQSTHFTLHRLLHHRTHFLKGISSDARLSYTVNCSVCTVYTSSSAHNRLNMENEDFLYFPTIMPQHVRIKLLYP